VELAAKLISMAIRRPRMWVLTGAGISTESGIPDFRSPGSGMWETVDPMEVFSVDGLTRNPKQFYDIGYNMFDSILNAPANSAHQVLGKMQQWGLIGPIVTQNIDNLHQKGGAFWAYEVHGHIRSATCMGCGNTNRPMREVLDQAASGELPRCPRCNAMMKPDVILFGDAMPADYINAINLKNAYGNHSLSMLVVGSSLVVAPINYLPEDFDELAIINNDKTALDFKADILWREQAGRALTQVEEYIYQQTGTLNPDRLPYGFLPGAVINSTFDRCLDAQGNPKDLPKEQAAKVYAEALLWQETLETYLARRKSHGMAGLVARTLQNTLISIIEAYHMEINLNQASQQAQTAVQQLINDSISAWEAYLKSSSFGQGQSISDKCREVLLGTVIGSMGWYEWLCRTWSTEARGLETWRDRILSRNYASREEIKRWWNEY